MAFIIVPLLKHMMGNLNFVNLGEIESIDSIK